MSLANLLALLFALIPFTPEAADWIQISSDYELEVVLLWDFPDVQVTRRPVKPYLSATRLTRYQCRAGGRASVETTLYRDNMARGEVMEIFRTLDAEIKFEWVNPEAPGGESMRKVCGSAAN